MPIKMANMAEHYSYYYSPLCQADVLNCPARISIYVESRHMQYQKCNLLGIGVQDGAGRPGCEMGPAALRTAGIEDAIAEQGYEVSVLRDVQPDTLPNVNHVNPALKNLQKIAAWTSAIQSAAGAAGENAFPVFMGGDHSLCTGTLPAMARRAEKHGKPFFVLWLDAHPDFHTLETTDSGHLHGVPLAYACGLPGFDGMVSRRLKHRSIPKTSA